MKLTTTELACVRSQGLHVTEKCDECGKLLNQSVRYAIIGKPEVFCSAECRELVFFRDRREARKHTSPGKCAYCNAKLKGKRRDALYCDGTCKQLFARKKEALSPAEPRLSGTPTEPDEQLRGARIEG